MRSDSSQSAEVELVDGQRLVVVGAVVPGRAVGDAAHLLDVAEVLVGADVLAALEEHVLEQVGEAGAARPLVLRADVVPEVDRHQRQRGVAVEDDAQAVVERMLGEAALEGEVDGSWWLHGGCASVADIDCGWAGSKRGPASRPVYGAPRKVSRKGDSGIWAGHGDRGKSVPLALR